jgi:hypothetical protein
MFKHLRWLQNLHQSMEEHAILCTDYIRRVNNFNNTIFVTNLRCERRGQLKLEIHVLFYRNNSATVAFRQIKFGTIKCRGHIFKF